MHIGDNVNVRVIENLNQVIIINTSPQTSTVPLNIYQTSWSTSTGGQPNNSNPQSQNAPTQQNFQQKYTQSSNQQHQLKIQQNLSMNLSHNLNKQRRDNQTHSISL
eukprot:403377060